MTYFDSIILGLVEGITEFLPVSSTGHMILVNKFLGGSGGEFAKSFEIIIQLGAILAVVALYFKVLLRDWEAWKRIMIAFIPTGILGLAFYKLIKTYLLGSPLVVVWSLMVGGIVIILFERWQKEKIDTVVLVPQGINAIDKISYRKAFYIGLFQSIAMIPGISRSAATIIGGMIMDIERKTIVEFSFLLAVPTMAAATGLDLVKNASAFSGQDWNILAVGFIISFLVAILVIKLFLKYIQKHDFTIFGYYRIIIAFIFWWLI